MQFTGNSFSPYTEEIELSIFGPGFGECIIVHLGLNDWMVVDSCLSPSNRAPIGLTYLDSLGIAPSNVKLIVATHWHDDHIEGIAELFNQCFSARFCSPPLICDKEFQTFIASWIPTRNTMGGSGLNELIKVLEIIRSRSTQGYPTPVIASPNKVLLERSGPCSYSVRSLSPSDVAVAALIARLKGIKDFNNSERRRLPAPDKNEASVALTIRLPQNTNTILLGADVEVRRDRSRGWLAIIDDHWEKHGHSAFKIPHHGSENGFHDEIWNRLLISNPFAVITPYINGDVRLPTLEESKRVVDRTSNSYLTAPPRPRRFESTNKTKERAIKEIAPGAYELRGRHGHVRLRKKFEESTWNCQLYGEALKLDEFIRQT